MNTTTRTTTAFCTIFLLMGIVPAAARVQAGYVDLVNASEFAAPQPYAAATASGPFVWTRDIVRPGATLIKIHFAEFDMAPGDVVTIASPDGRHVEHYEELGPRGTGEFWALAVPGERAIVTLTSYGAGGRGIAIDHVGVGTPIRTADAICGTDGREDIACYGNGANAKEIMGPVARLLFADGPFLFVCTGFLVRGSSNSMLMTNQHCIDNQTGVNSLEAWFNYQNATCGGFIDDPFDAFFGNSFLKTDVGLDYSLMTLSGNPESQYGEWVATRKNVSVNDIMAIPQHSGGDEKTLALFEGNNRTGGKCQVDGVRRTISGWDSGSQINYTCDMEGGASGSPVVGKEQGFDVIGINHVETVNCAGNQGNYATHMDDICDNAGSLLNCS